MVFKIEIKKFAVLFCLLFICSISSANEIFISLKKNKVNVRYGPSFDSDIKYVYKKVNLPIKQIDKKENFRRIIDLKNNSGWIHVSQLKRINSVIATKDKILFQKPTSCATPISLIKKGRLWIVQNCEKKWCEIKTDDFNGWIKTDDLWGLTN